MRIAKNKALSSYFLNLFGYNVPKHIMVYQNESLKKAYEFIDEIDYPAIVKLNESSQGNGVYKVYNYVEFDRVVKMLTDRNVSFQIQKYYSYNDYRVVVLGDKVISAYQRIPLYVIGDGVNTIEHLLKLKQNAFISNGRDTVLSVDTALIEKLKRYGYNLKTVLCKGKKCTLRDVSNLSAGGDCIDLTNKIHKGYMELCVNIAKDFNLNLVGIDIMCNDLCNSMNDYVILEINSSPGLDNYAYSGWKQEEYVKQLYTKVILYIKNKLC